MSKSPRIGGFRGQMRKFCRILNSLFCILTDNLPYTEGQKRTTFLILTNNLGLSATLREQPLTFFNL
ncbi:hypothetical protein [Moorena sp. SIO4G3]|uniref:hypothetical protein n=1 Tax=Moorena sp. SIO4G3 TaxID=2607821 RepID=UPI0025E6A858|nr:hypothetical protein [Moorena sp. SIO4G3]